MSTPSTQLENKYVSVVLDKGIDKLLDYKLPKDLNTPVSEGMRVVVPLRSRYVSATILEIKETSKFEKVLPIIKLEKETPFLKPDQIRLAKWISEYYCASLRKVLKLFIPSSVKGKATEKHQYFISLTLPLSKLKSICADLRQKHPSQAKILDVFLKHPKGLLLSELLQLTNTSKSPIDSLIKKQILTQKKIHIDRTELLDHEFFISHAKKLNDEQKSALDKIKQSIDSRTSQTHLIHGVTGSGKTEIYLQAIDYVRKLGKSVIFMVPEVALTTQTIERLKSRFTEKIAILHHRLSHGERHDMWQNIYQKKVSIVIGARSAIFAPLENIGLIIVDEEHDSSYKQTEESPCYHARDLAVLRGHFSNAVTVLGSATPSIESYTHALSNKYVLNSLTKRAATNHFPDIHIVDMKREMEKTKKFTLFSQQLLNGIKKRLDKGEQTLLFLNKRGYHSVILCKSCEKPLSCPHCDVSMTYHKKANLAMCHYCSYSICPPPRKCPYCHSDTVEYKGVGTEKVQSMLKAIFPEIRTLRMDADTTRHKGSHTQIFNQFRSGKADVLIGTQMIAKGFDFPDVTLVGILNSDQGLYITDFRAEELCFQLLTQVSGRSGRSSLKGEVFIQTNLIDHPLFSFVQTSDYQGFYKKEISLRKLFHYPPYTRISKFIIKGPSQEKTRDLARSLRALIIKNTPPNTLILPEIPDFRIKLQDEYRYYFLVKTPSILPFSKTVKKLFESFVLPSHYKILIDIDSI